MTDTFKQSFNSGFLRVYKLTIILGISQLMQAWTTVIVIWFLTLLFSIFLVSYYVYKEIYAKHKKQKFYHTTQLQPWFLLLLFSAAITIVLIWYLLEQNHYTKYKIESSHPWLFVGLTVGLFAVICTTVTCVWSTKTQSNCFVTDIASNSTRLHTRATIDFGGVLGPGSIDIDQKMNWGPSDEILVLRNLSEPTEDFVINLSNPSTPVSKRKSFSAEDNESGMDLPDGIRSRDDTTAHDFNC